MIAVNKLIMKKSIQINLLFLICPIILITISENIISTNEHNLIQELTYFIRNISISILLYLTLGIFYTIIYLAIILCLDYLLFKYLKNIKIQIILFSVFLTVLAILYYALTYHTKKEELTLIMYIISIPFCAFYKFRKIKINCINTIHLFLLTTSITNKKQTK